MNYKCEEKTLARSWTTLDCSPFPCFPVRSSRSSALRFGAAILDEFQNYLGGGGRFGRKRVSYSPFIFLASSAPAP